MRTIHATSLQPPVAHQHHVNDAASPAVRHAENVFPDIMAAVSHVNSAVARSACLPRTGNPRKLPSTAAMTRDQAMEPVIMVMPPR